jgi:hypothetical protein
MDGRSKMKEKIRFGSFVLDGSSHQTGDAAPNPPAGPQLFVITGDAVTSRSHSSQILMEWLSAQLNDYTQILIAAGRAFLDVAADKEVLKKLAEVG